MNAALKDVGKGIGAAAISVVIAMAGIGLYLVLTLLVIAMEEGGENLSVYAMPCTETALLLAQGVGFDLGSFRLTITPLLLTLLLIGMIRAFCLRWKVRLPGYAGGLVCWVAVALTMAGGVNVTIFDPAWLIAIKSALVFSLGWFTAYIGLSDVMNRVRTWIRGTLSASIRNAVFCALAMTLCITAWYLILGLVCVIVWISLNHGTIGELFALSDMQIGSRILTTAACIVWLPNLCLWAVSWLFGPGFSIGDIASFSLWIGQSDGLPAVPIFGAFPDAVDSDPVRIALMMIPIVTGCVAGMLIMILPQGLHIRAPKTGDRHDPVRMVRLFAKPVIISLATIALVSTIFALLFVCSNGALGHARLSHVGVDVMQSTRTIGQGTALGLLVAWLLVLIGVYAIFGIRWARRALRRSSGTAVDAGDAVSEVQPTADSRTVFSMPTTKEE